RTCSASLPRKAPASFRSATTMPPGEQTCTCLTHSSFASRRRALAIARLLSQSCHHDACPRLHLGERLHVAERLGEHVAGRREPGLVALRNRRAAKAERAALALPAERDLPRRHDRAGALLTRQVDGCLEIDLLAPGHGRGRERQRRRDRLGGRRIEELGIERQRAEIETDALCHDGPVFPESTERKNKVSDEPQSMTWEHRIVPIPVYNQAGNHGPCCTCNQRSVSSRCSR